MAYILIKIIISVYLQSNKDKFMYATLSADIVSSTSLSKEGTIELKQKIDGENLK